MNQTTRLSIDSLEKALAGIKAEAEKTNAAMADGTERLFQLGEAHMDIVRDLENLYELAKKEDDDGGENS